MVVVSIIGGLYNIWLFPHFFHHRSFASQYRRFTESTGNNRRASVPVITRKQLASSSSSTDFLERYTAPAEEYIGRALPRYLPEFFRVSDQPNLYYCPITKKLNYARCYIKKHGEHAENIRFIFGAWERKTNILTLVSQVTIGTWKSAFYCTGWILVAGNAYYHVSSFTH